MINANFMNIFDKSSKISQDFSNVTSSKNPTQKKCLNMPTLHTHKYFYGIISG